MKREESRWGYWVVLIIAGLVAVRFASGLAEGWHAELAKKPPPTDVVISKVVSMATPTRDTTTRGSARADSDLDYVRRPHGWFLLAPPLTKPDHVTGLQYVDEDAPKSKWTGMIVRGYDGHDYDLATAKTCEAFKTIIALQAYARSSHFLLDWVSKSPCTKDDGRRLTKHWSTGP